MILDAPSKPICLPPAPLNGGRLETAPSKVGEWVWQPKIDDWRAIIHAPTSTVWNQYGKLSSIADKFGPVLDAIQTRAKDAPRLQWLDVGLMENRNDLMRGTIVILDLIEPLTAFTARRDALEIMFPKQLKQDMAYWLALYNGRIENGLFLVNQFLNKNPLEIYRYLQNQNAEIGHKFFEGLVAKKQDSVYPFFQKSKTQTPYWIKHRFDQ